MKSSPRSGFVNPLLVYALIGFGFSGSVGVGTVWLQHQISVEANVDKALEARIDAVERQSEQVATEIAEAQDAGELLRRNAQWNLGLSAPAEDHIYRITEDPVQHLARKGDHQELAAGAPAPGLIRLALQR